MFLRCSSCHGSFWISPEEGSGSDAAAACVQCGQAYELKNARALLSQGRDFYIMAKSFATENDIDLPGAFSVLLGIASLERIIEVGRSVPPAGEALPEAAPDTVEAPPLAVPAAAGAQTRSKSNGASAPGSTFPDRSLFREQPADAVARETESAVAVLEAEEEEEAAEGGGGEPPGFFTEASFATASRPSAEETRYDPGFQGAIEAGRLSAAQAYERGNRDAFARRLADRHTLPLELAYEVTDNRISLLHAVRSRKAVAAIKAVPPKRRAEPSRGKRFAVVATVLMALAAVWFLYLSPAAREPKNFTYARVEGTRPFHDPEAANRKPKENLPPAKVSVDSEGDVVLVVGPDAASVLLAFCEATDGGYRYEPLGLIEAVPPEGGSKLAVVRDADGDGALYALPIVQDPGSGQWVAGTGDVAVSLDAAPHTAIRALQKKS